MMMIVVDSGGAEGGIAERLWEGSVVGVVR